MPDIKGAGEGAAEKGKGALTRKVGPLPLWGWAIAGVAAVVVVKKFTGGGGSAGSGGSFAIPNLGSGAPAGSVASGTTVANPAQNATGGADTVTAGPSTVPWWANPLNWSAATPGIPLTGQPSSNGSAGNGPAKTTPTGAPPPPTAPPSWWTRLTNPAGNLPAGAAVTTIGGINYSLSSDALGRAGITGASAPTAPAVPPASQTASAPTANLGGYQGTGMGYAQLRNENN